uniref:beta strand repeat-containing protein n=1 Tax=Kiloniella majae TaxID=1938558 RepID=UPI000F77086C
NLIKLTGTITDGDSDTASADIDLGGNLVFKDDGPTAVDDTDCVEVVVDDLPPQNIAFVVDESGSVGQSNYQTQIDGVRTFMDSLVSQGDPAELAMSLVTFGSNAEDYGTFVYQDDGNGVLDLDDFVRLNNDGTLSSTTLDDTLITVRADYDSAGSTNYDAGMQSLFSTDSEYLNNPVSSLSDAESRLYFISDGGPNATSTSNSSEIDTDIATAITNNNIQVTGIGIGTSASVENGLEDYFLAVDGADASNPNIPAAQYSFVAVPNFADLADALDGTTGAAPVATGNVVTGVDVAGGDANVTDGNADSMGADGFGSITWAGATGGTTVVGTYGTLTVDADGNYSYALDYSNPAVTGLAQGATLPEVFTYTVTDGDGDTDTATLTLTIKGADHDVTITGLTPEVSGGDIVVNEENLSDGSNPDAGALTQTGDFTVTAVDGVDDVTINGVLVIENGSLTNNPVTTPLGNSLTVTGFNSTTGEVTYNYTLGDNENHPTGNGENDLFDNMNVVVTDNDGDSASDTLSVRIVDDVPTAVDDVDSVTEDGPLVADGNVITGAGGSDANATDGVADTAGADGITSIAWSGVSGTTVTGLYGTLTVGTDGSYSYELDNNNATVKALSDGETLDEVFNYTVTDGDGDTDTAKLTITVNGTNDEVEITNLTPEAQGGDAAVDEDDLADGSSPDAGALTQAGDFNISAPDGLDDLTIGGTLVITNGAFTPVTITTPEGNSLEITAFDAVSGKVSYTYTLVDNTTGHGPADNGENNLFDNLTVTLTDVDGDSASSTLSIKIVDDVPTAVDDAVTTTTDASVLPQNIAFVVDESGSVGQSNYQTQIDGVRTFMTDLVDNGSPEKLAFSLVTFGSNSEDYGTFVFKDNGAGGIDLDDFVRVNNDGTLSSTTLDNTLITVRGNYSSGSTNYDAGMQSLFGSNSEYLTNSVTDLPLSQNRLYFVSDGAPNATSTSNDDEIDQSVATAIINNAVQVTGIGIGTSSGVEDGLEDYFLNQGGGDSSNPSIPGSQYDYVSVPNFADLADQLLNAAETTQQIASGSLVANDDLGADGASVTAISIGGVAATFNGSTNSWELDGATFDFAYNPATDEFVLIFDEGDEADLAVNYTITDGDGDTSSAVLNITVPDPLSAVDDSIITNITSGDIDIPDWVLTQNDGGSSARDISGVSNATDGSISHDGSADETTFTLPTPAPFGTSYTIVNEAANDDFDTPLNDTRATAVDLTDRSQWGPVTDSNAGNVKNSALPSILFKADIDNRDTGNNRDYDYVMVSLLAGEKLILDIDNGEGGSGNQDVDARIRLYDASGTQLATNDDSAITNGGAGSTDDRDSYLEYTASSDGTYYVRVESYSRNDDGDYDLWLSVDNSGVSTPTPGFDYTVEDGGISDDASVVISTVDSLTLTGTGDGEILIGGSLADIINAGGGDDILIGGAGANTLTGGTGADTFVLSDISSQDVITDFNGTADDGDGDVLNLHDLLVEVGLDQAAIDALNDGNISDYVQLDSSAGITTVSVSSGGGSGFTTVATLNGVGDSEVVKVQVDEDHILNLTTL